MKKKVILLLSLIILLCGCSAEVNLEVTPSSIDENISIVTTANNVYTKDIILAGFREYMPIYYSVEIPDTEPDEAVSGVQYYEHEREELNNGYKNIYSNKFEFGKYRFARSVNEAFRSVNIQNSSIQKQILISTDSGGMKLFNTFPELENVKVNIKTDYEVIKNNADSVNGNVYTWYFSKDTKKSIYLVMSNTKKTSESDSKKGDYTKDGSSTSSFMDKHPILIAVLGILGFFVLALVLSKIKIKG